MAIGQRVVENSSGTTRYNCAIGSVIFASTSGSDVRVRQIHHPHAHLLAQGLRQLLFGDVAQASATLPNNSPGRRFCSSSSSSN